MSIEATKAGNPYKYPYTISELVNEIYEDNYSHFEFEENMGGEPCDCHLHITMETIVKYWGE
jgi:hypothetical protein